MRGTPTTHVSLLCHLFVIPTDIIAFYTSTISYQLLIVINMNTQIFLMWFSLWSETGNRWYNNVFVNLWSWGVQKNFVVLKLANCFSLNKLNEPQQVNDGNKVSKLHLWKLLETYSQIKFVKSLMLSHFPRITTALNIPCGLQALLPVGDTALWEKQPNMLKLQNSIILIVLVGVLVSIVRGTISPGKFKKFAHKKGTVGVIGQ